MNVDNCIKENLMKDEQPNLFDVSLAHFYAATKDQECFDKLIERANVWCDNHGAFEYSDLNAGKVLYDCYLETKEEKYRDGIEQLHREWKSFWQDNDCPKQNRADWLCMAGPFEMAYETAFNNKEHYNEIVETFENVNIGGEFSLPLATSYAMALIDTMGVMSKEIFEHYKTLERLFKNTIQGILKTIKNENNSYQEIDKSDIEKFALSDLAKTAYVILKACRMKVLLQEKYQATGMELLRYILAVVYDIQDEKLKPAANDEVMAVAMMAYAESLMLESTI